MAISNEQIIFPDGESLATKMSSGGGAVIISDNGVQVTSAATEINFASNLDVVDAGGGVVNVSAGGDVSNPLTDPLELGGHALKDTSGGDFTLQSSSGVFRFEKP